MSNFRSTFDKPFSGVPKILINKQFYKWLSWNSEQEINIDDEFTEDVRTSLMSNFRSTFDKPFSGVPRLKA